MTGDVQIHTAQQCLIMLVDDNDCDNDNDDPYGLQCNEGVTIVGHEYLFVIHNDS